MGLEVLMTNFVRRNVSSTCNSSGSALWALAKNIKPLVDANVHTEAIEFAYHQSPIRFSPIYYQNPGFISRSPNGQTILFGCSLKLRTVGELKKIPPLLEYLLDSVRNWPGLEGRHNVGQKHRNRITHRLYCKPGESWPLVHEVEQAWTGVEERDRGLISKLVQAKLRLLILVCLLRCTNTGSCAERPCRITFGRFQSQYCRMMILHWYPTVQA